MNTSDYEQILFADTFSIYRETMEKNEKTQTKINKNKKKWCCNSFHGNTFAEGKTEHRNKTWSEIKKNQQT